MGMPLPPRALLLSLGLHLVVGLAVTRSAFSLPTDAVAPDVWSGYSVDVETVALTSDAPAAPATPEKPVEPAEPAAAPPQPETTPETEPASAAEREPAIRPKRASKPRAAATPSASENAPAAAAPGENDGLATTASFGSAGLPLHVRHLPGAFTRALPAVAYHDDGWAKLPLGPAGEFVVDLVVDEEGKLGELVYVDSKVRDRLSPPLRHMVEKAMVALRGGTFSVALKARESGRQRFKLSVEISQEAPPETAGVLFNKGYEAPRPGHPGNARFLLPSGRRIFTRIWLLPGD